MKKIIRLSILFLTIALFLFSCRKDRDNTYNEISEEYLSIEVEIIN